MGLKRKVYLVTFLSSLICNLSALFIPGHIWSFLNRGGGGVICGRIVEKVRGQMSIWSHSRTVGYRFEGAAAAGTQFQRCSLLWNDDNLSMSHRSRSVIHKQCRIIATLLTEKNKPITCYEETIISMVTLHPFLNNIRYIDWPNTGASRNRWR